MKVKMQKGLLLKWATGQGFKGKSLDGLKAFLDEKGLVPHDPNGKEIDIDGSWHTTKAVTISYDSAVDDVSVVDESMGESDDGEDYDEKMGDEDEDGEKSAKPKRSRIKSIHEDRKRVDRSGGGGFSLNAKNWNNIAKRKSYTLAAQQGRSYRNSKCVYADGDRAEFAGAIIRMAGFANHTDPEVRGIYHGKQFRRDEEVVQKAGQIGDNVTYGNFVIEEVLPELIENFNTFGAARQLATVTPMLNDSRTVMKWEDDVDVYDVDEGATITESDGESSRVTVYAKKTAALTRVSNELLADSAIDMSNQLSNSITRSVGRWEDRSFLLGENNRPGLLTTTAADAGSTYDAGALAGVSSWGDYTVSALQEWKAKLAGWALESENLAIVCNPSFYEAVLKVRAYSAGGTPGEALLNGTTIRAWDGVPVVFSHVMPRTYTANQISAYIGAFDRAVKFGVVRGSESMAQSTERYFETDETAMRYTQRWGYTLHDVTGSESGVVALQD